MSELLELHHICKTFGSTRVLDDVSLVVRAGEVHALVGENGAGKSTLVRVAAGVMAPDSGSVIVRGVARSASVSAAHDAGIHLIHQEPTLFPDLEVADNMLLEDAPRRRFPPGIDWNETRALAARQLDRLECGVSPRARVRDLSVADQQMVDIAAALLRRPQVLIVDEPTAALSPIEVSRLFEVLRSLQADGVAIVFIGHRLEEVFAIADRITVLRDGHHVRTSKASSTDHDQVIADMVGRDSTERERVFADRIPGPVVLRVRNVSTPGYASNVNIDVQAGEIVGLAGLVGAGRTQLAEAIFGVRNRTTGTVEVASNPTSTPREAIRAGLAFVPEERGRHGLALQMSVADNVTLISLRDISRRGIRRPAKERAVAEDAVGRFGVRLRATDQSAGELSGGNQQRVSLAKWLRGQSRILIVDEPTRGVDVAAKAEIHKILDGLARDGLGVLMISSELPEILALSDRILVMRDGRIVGKLPRCDATPERVIRLATGQADVVADAAR